MWTRRAREAWLAKAEAWAETPSANPLQRWLVGVLVAAIPAAIGLLFVGAERSLIVGRRFTVLHLAGRPAIVEGIGFLGLAALIHFHWFWLPHARWHAVGQIGRCVGLLIIAACAMYVSYWYFVRM